MAKSDREYDRESEMKLTGEQPKELSKILASTLEDRDGLERFVYYDLQETPALIIKDPDANFEHAIYEVIHWANREHRVEGLLTALLKDRSKNEELTAFVEAVKASQPAPAPAPTDFIQADEENINLAGIVGFTDNFHVGISWGPLFTRTRNLDIFFSYGRTWRQTHRQTLLNVMTKSAIRIRVVLPDPEHESTVAQLMEHFNYTPEKVRDYISDAVIFFRNLEQKANKAGSGSSVDIWFLTAVPKFTFYRFDEVAVLAWFSHRRDQPSVPVILVERGGKLYSFVEEEFSAMIAGEAGLIRPAA